MRCYITAVALLMPALFALPEAYCQGGNLVIGPGKKVTFEYTLKVDDEIVDTTKGKGPISYVQGKTDILPGLSARLAGLKEGDEREFIVPPAEGYGVKDPEALVEIERSKLPSNAIPMIGAYVKIDGPDGTPLYVRIVEIGKDAVVVDLNHPLAGKELKFSIKIVNVE